MFKTNDSGKSSWHRVFMMFMLACLSLPCLVLAGLAQSTYTITDLGTLPDGTFSQGWGINASGQVTGWGDTVGGVTHAFLYTLGTTPPMLDLGTLPGGTSSQGWGINASGQVTGNADATGNFVHAFLYTPGVTPPMSDLGTIGDSLGFSYGLGINDSGWITGDSVPYNYAGIHHAFLYTPGAIPPMSDLGTLDNGVGYSGGFGINASGQVTGYSFAPSGYEHAFIYTPSANPPMSDLGSLLGAYITSLGRGINAAGQVTGQFVTSTGDSHAFLYTSGIDPLMIDLDPTGIWSQGMAINASGQVVGTFQSGTRAFLYSPGKGVIDLNDLLPSGSSWVLGYATSINDSGQITGYGSYNGEQHAFLLTPSEPITQILSSQGGTANFIFENDTYNIVYDYPAGFVTDGSTLTVTPIQTSQADWALRTPEGNPYHGTQLAPVTGLGGDGIIYRAVCLDPAGQPCAEHPDLSFGITTSWNGPAGENPGFLKAPLGTNNWENVLISYSPTRLDGPDPTGAGKSRGGFSDWAFVYDVTGTAPGIQITTPVGGATYTLNQVVNANYSCPGDHVMACLGSVPNSSAIDTSSLGAKAFTVNATVSAGPTAVQTVAYTVVEACHYAWFTLNPSSVPLGGSTKVTANLQSCSGVSQKVALRFTWTVPAPGSCSSNTSVILTTPTFLLKPKTSISFTFPLWIPKRICTGTYTVNASTLVGGVVVDTTSTSLTVTSK